MLGILDRPLWTVLNISFVFVLFCFLFTAPALLYSIDNNLISGIYIDFFPPLWIVD